MESKRTETTYFIPPGKFLLMENALGNPDLIQSSVSSDCRVTIVDLENFPLDDLEQWPTSRLISADIKLKLGEGKYYIYIVVPTPDNTESTSAFISYNTVKVDRKGYGEDGTLLGKAGFRYYPCGTVSARGGNPSATTVPSGQGRLIEMDLGVTPVITNIPGNLSDLETIFQIEKPDPSNPSSWLMTIVATIKSMTARIIRVTSSLIFGSGDNERPLTGVAVREDAENPEKVSDTIIATTAWVDAKFEQLDDRYLRKDKDDRSVGTIASDKGFLVGNADRGMSIDPETNIVTAVLDRLMEVLNIQSQEFAMGEWGNGFILKYDKKTGQSYFEVDRMLVRKVAYFVELIIKQLSHVGGQLVLSPANMRCSRVEEYGEYYRCYFENERDGKTINNEFKVGDQARAQSFNVKEGTNHNVSSQYYWRLVVGVGDNYIDLSKIDCDAGSLPPLAGDDIVQLGNRTDPERQNAIILSTVGEDAPSFKQYEGIQYYTLAGKEVTVISPKGNVITGDFLSKSGKDLLGYIDDLGARLDDVQYQTDKHYTIWFYDYNPTLENYPASEWMDDDAKRQHVQDIFYNEEEGLAFRFLEVSEGVFVWNDITDHETIKALEKAAKAQKTADGKIRNFVAQPVPPYDEGDRWSNASYTSSDGTVLYDNDDLVCVTSKAEGEIFDIADWQPTSGQDSTALKKIYSEFSRLDGEISAKVTAEYVGGQIAQSEMRVAEAVAGLYVKNDTFNSSIEALSGQISLKVSSDNIINSINISPEAVTIDASKINLNGQVTFSMLAKDTQDTINGKATQANIDASVKGLKDTLGTLAYQSSIEKAQLDETIISGGYIKSELLHVTEIYATTGTIGGFDIGEKSLTNNAGDVSLSIGNLTGTKFAALNNECALSVRYDDATALSAYSHGTNGIAIRAQGQTGALAIRSVGSAEMIARSSESITISGLALACKKGTTFTGASNTDVSTGWVDFLVATGNFELPSASNCEGKILFVKANGTRTITSASPIVNCDGTGYYGTNDDGKYSKSLGSTALFYLSDGSVWYEFRCI